MALDLPIPRKLLVHPHLTLDKKKMTKSLGNVVDPYDEFQYGDVEMDVLRWYFVRSSGNFDKGFGK